ncbi:MAG: recombination regulator RecX [Betaproteobacteria bacterium]|nr:recombination regulator RecX [Betaproteobacteria bacterium]
MDESEGRAKRKRPTMSLHARALKLLAGREYSRAELAKKLAFHADSPEVLEALLDDLVRRNVLSDARYADARSRQLARKFGPTCIQHELRSKGLDQETVERSVDVAKLGALENARAVWGKRFGAPPADALAKAKQMRFLQMRGFSFDIIRAVVPRVGADPDD